MDYSFECGSCHAIYKLSENQITDKGVKITCPKCLSYFILKKGAGAGSGQNLESAYIEYIVSQDGLQQETARRIPPSPPPVNQFQSEVKTEKIITSDVTEKIPIKNFSPKSTPSKQTPKGKSTKTSELLPPYPVLKKNKNKALPYLLIFFVLAAAIWALYYYLL